MVLFWHAKLGQVCSSTFNRWQKRVNPWTQRFVVQFHLTDGLGMACQPLNWAISSKGTCSLAGGVLDGWRVQMHLSLVVKWDGGSPRRVGVATDKSVLLLIQLRRQQSNPAKGSTIDIPNIWNPLRPIVEEQQQRWL